MINNCTNVFHKKKDNCTKVKKQKFVQLYNFKRLERRGEKSYSLVFIVYISNISILLWPSISGAKRDKIIDLPKERETRQ